MRSTLILLASAIALAGCSKEPAEPAQADPAEPVAAAPAAAPAGPVTGTLYDVTYADGTTGKFTVNADGTYSASGPDGDVTGAHMVEDGKHCFDPEGDGEDLGKMCWTVQPSDETGTFTATSDAGVTATSTPAAS